MRSDDLPIDAISDEFIAALQTDQPILVRAEPGAGKSSRLPLWALDHSSLALARIILIQPRRLAAAAVAGYLAEQLGQPLGETVGLRTRDEVKIGRCTRLEVVTVGVFVRQIQSDPELDGVGMVIFDEFHERSAMMDLSLGFAALSCSVLRDDPLRLVVMSATLAIEPLLRQWPDARLLQCGGRTYPVETQYQSKPSRLPMESHVAAVILQVLKELGGDVLVFLPGISSINAVAGQLTKAGMPAGVALHRLHSSIDLREQRAAIASPPHGVRKLVLSTNIAETSLTIDGVRVVIDSGLERRAQFDYGRGVTKLVTGMVSQAAAEQRRGRAGRTAPGRCIRLWDRENHDRLRAFDHPEILSGDIAPVLLEAALFGEPDLAVLFPLDQPPEAHRRAACALLQQLGAIDGRRRITPRGERMAGLGLSPRLAAMCVHAQPLGDDAMWLACVVATLVSEGVGSRDGSDLRRVLQVLPARQRVQSLATRLMRRMAGRAVAMSLSHLVLDELPALILAAFPDRIARQRAIGSERYLLANGQEARLLAEDSLNGSPWLVVVEAQGEVSSSVIQRAIAVSESEVLSGGASLRQRRRSAFWDIKRDAAVAEEIEWLGCIELNRRVVPLADGERLEALVDHVRARGLECFSLEAFRPWQARVNWLWKQGHRDLPDTSDEALLATVDEWLPLFAGDAKSARDLARLDLLNVVKGQMDWSLMQRIDSLAPESIELPTGQRRRIEYQRLAKPALSARLQEVFGWKTSPTINNGADTLLIELLSPASRPVQLTDDLAGFWSGTYADVKKELRGRYPKHYWPDDPANAQATHRVQPRPSGH